MKVKCNVDLIGYSEKPKGAEIGALRNRLGASKALQEIEPDELVQLIKEGRSFTPGALEGTTAASWTSQQIICADIDNDTGRKAADGKHICLNEPLTVEGAIQVMKQYGIIPYCIYNSFSMTETWPKFRIVLILAEPITDPEEAEDLIERFTGIFNSKVPHCADSTSKDLARLYFGGRPDSVVDYRKGITDLYLLRDIPKPEKFEADLPDFQEDRQEDPVTEEASDSRQEPRNRFEEMQADYEYQKAHFDLAAYVEKTSGSTPVKHGKRLYFNPCPICGHNDDFCISSSDRSFTCYSANGLNKGGGTIIDYLMHTKKLTQAEALDYFQFEILGIDRNEWNHAYYEAQNEAAASIPDYSSLPWPDEVPDLSAAEEPEEDPDRAAILNRPTGEKMLDSFFAEIQTDKYRPVPTGINNLDYALYGGFQRGTLVTLGAAPGLGKTTIAQFILENMARAGTDVLYINLEMDRNQMLARSFSRLIFENSNAGKLSDLTSLDILRGYTWTSKDYKTVSFVMDIYGRTIAPHIVYNPDDLKDTGNRIQGILTIMRKEAARLIAENKRAPIVCVDYLQLIECDILEPGERTVDTATGIRRILKALKDYALDFNTVVIVVMANNRASNSEGRSSIDSGRDTSNIEYAGDLMLGLSYTAIVNHETYIAKYLKETGEPVYKPVTLEYINKQIDKAEREHEDRPIIAKKLSLEVVKSRFSVPNKRANFIFDGRHSTFIIYPD